MSTPNHGPNVATGDIRAEAENSWRQRALTATVLTVAMITLRECSVMTDNFRTGLQPGVEFGISTLEHSADYAMDVPLQGE